MVGQLQTFGGQCSTKDGVVPSGTDVDCCCAEGGGEVTCGSGCDDSTAAAEYLIEISGIANGSCGSCSSYDGSYVVSFIGAYTSGTVNGCLWGYDSGSSACTLIRYLHLFISGTTIYVSWNDTAASPGTAARSIRFEKTFPPSNCTTYSSLNVAVIKTNSGQCGNSSATCTVTAL